MVGTEAVRVYADGQRMLKRLIEGRWLTANAVVALYPANTVNDDDIEFYTDESRTEVALTWYGLRQQTEKQEIDGVMRPSRCLADFVAPKGVKADYAGLFAVTAGIGVDKKEKYFLDDHGRLFGHHAQVDCRPPGRGFCRVRCTTGCAPICGAMRPTRRLSNEDLIAEKYQGIRPAPGYPCLPGPQRQEGHVRRCCSVKRLAWR